MPDLPQFSGRKTRDIAAERAGFGGRETYRQAAKVVEKGAPELVQAMDAGKVSISAAAQIADLAADKHQSCQLGAELWQVRDETSAMNWSELMDD